MTLAVLAILTFAASGCAVVNRFHVPPAVEAVPVAGGAPVRLAGTELSVVTFNIGYAGMGRDADFVLDGGKQQRPRDKRLVEDNLAAIVGWLAGADADVLLLQEVARPSFSTYGMDVLEALSAAAPDTTWTFGPDIKTRFVPPPFRTVIGNASFSRVEVAGAEARGLPLEPKFQFGLFRKGYRAHILRLAGPDAWTIVNVHLAAFDSVDAAIREKQLAAVLAFAQDEYLAGRHVVVGGDFNMRLVVTRFPHATAAAHLFWIRDLLPDSVPKGWRVAADSRVPTVRTAHQPYTPAVNYTTIVDGFLLSPNVELVDVRTEDLRFIHTDHHPVRVVVRAADR
ncbi:endonuclease/exonuclease/phosphatase family protein [Paracoccus sp. T5]|uniref:endonuclease/exonuclease/phosphatase family protein n=1 Tax=Paracoccus sp. T5 TaxID=3402161 RepID=UPI003AE7A914